MEDMIYWSFIHKIWGVKGNRILANLLGKIRGKDFWEIRKNDIINFPEISQEMVDVFMKERIKNKWEKEYKLIIDLNLKILSIKDFNYPRRLKHIYAPPPLIYIRGNLPEKNLVLAIIGARKASVYGKKFARNLAKELSENNIQIISGLARGIDTAGHEGAIASVGGTIAVLGSGIDIIYPRENKNLFEKIINSRDSAVISEFPLGTPPYKYNFPIRNRIISGLSDGIIVVEARERSGSLITTDFALEQGKEIFVVPGQAGNPLYKGSHKLIKEGAKLVDGVSDILDEFGQMCLFKKEELKNNLQLNKIEKKLLECLAYEPKTVDELISMTNLSANTVIPLLSVLEIKGLIKQSPGRKFISMID